MKKNLIILIICLVPTLLFSQISRKMLIEETVNEEKTITNVDDCYFDIQQDEFYDENVYDYFYSPLRNEILFTIQHITAIRNKNGFFTYNAWFLDNDSKYYCKIRRNNYTYIIDFSNYSMIYLFDL